MVSMLCFPRLTAVRSVFVLLLLTHTRMHTRARTYTCTYTHARTHVHTQMHTHTNSNSHTHTHTHQALLPPLSDSAMTHCTCKCCAPYLHCKTKQIAFDVHENLSLCSYPSTELIACHTTVLIPFHWTNSLPHHLGGMLIAPRDQIRKEGYKAMAPRVLVLQPVVIHVEWLRAYRTTVLLPKIC